MPGGPYTDDFRSGYPGSSSVNWFSPSRREGSRTYSPMDSSDIDHRQFRRDAFSFDRRTGAHPRDYEHYGGGYGGDRLASEASRMRSRSGSTSGGYSRRPSYSSSSRDYESSSRYPSSSRYGDDDSSSRSRSRFADFLSSSSSGRRNRSPPRERARSPRSSSRTGLSSRYASEDTYGSRSGSSYKYYSPEDVGRSSSRIGSRSGSRSGSSYEYFSPDDVGRRSSSRRPSYSYGSSGGYNTYEVRPSGGRFEID